MIEFFNYIIGCFYKATEIKQCGSSTHEDG